MSKTIVITSGYFNPVHPGHIECFQQCKALGDELRVIVNNDLQAQIKTGTQELFQDEEFRMSIVSALQPVDRVMLSVDTDTTVCASIQVMVTTIRQIHGPETTIIFGKGGDRNTANIPELTICNQLGVTIRDGLGEKKDHSKVYREKRMREKM